MPAGSLLALVDDIALLLDDIAAMSKLAAQKTAGVLGDDLALNAQQVSGVAAARELPVVAAVARGSLVNKAVLVPAALLIAQVAPWAITPLLMVGGAYLCFEGVEKLAHSLSRRREGGAPDAEAAHAQRLHAALVDPSQDLQALERDRVRGAVRTDFVLSAEIIAITLGTVATAGWAQQLAVLTVVALLMTVGVYGFVALIVKLDDLGLWLARRPGPASQAVGGVLVQAAPWLMKALSIAGTLAMFLVGGGILVHGLPPVHHAIDALAPGNAAVALAGDLITGVVAGALVLAAVSFVQRLRGAAH